MSERIRKFDSHKDNSAQEAADKQSDLELKSDEHEALHKVKIFECPRCGTREQFAHSGLPPLCKKWKLGCSGGDRICGAVMKEIN